MATIVGIDLALTHTGIAVIVSTVSGELVTASARLIETAKPKKKSNLYAAVIDIQRATLLYTGIMDELRESRPALIAVELPSGSQSAVASKCGGIAKGVITGIREALPEVPFLWFHQNQVKQALLGRSKVNKEEMAAAVLERLPDLQDYLDEIAKTKREHITDAAAVVIASEGTELWRAAMGNSA